jgi:predicted RNA-binding Zn ribbon-like protein
MVTAKPTTKTDTDAASTERSEPDYVFDFCGGHLAVDFTNTVGNRGDAEASEEHFLTYGDVVAWAEAAGVLGKTAAARLRGRAARHPDAARPEFRRALDARESVYRVLAACARHTTPAAADLAALNRHVGRTFAGASLAPAGDAFALESRGGEGLDAVLRPVVRAAVDLLTSGGARRLGICADEGCAWLFLDTTRSGTRRWCDMRQCGNRNKVRRFRAGYDR